MRSLLLLIVVSAMPLAAQFDPDLRFAIVPDRLDAKITGSSPGAFVGLVLGFEPAPVPVPLPGGAVLLITPLVMPVMGIADLFGNTSLSVRFPAGSGAGLVFLAQAVVSDANLGIGATEPLRVTPVRQARVPCPGEVAELVVLFGQSNAEGSAPLAELPAHERGSHPGLRIWNDVVGQWQPLVPGENNMLFPQVPRVGPEIGMAAIAALQAQPVWLVKFAVAQSSLGPSPGPYSEWGPGAGELYGELLRRIDAAALGVRALGLVPRVRLVCMMQGESDSLDPVLAAAYSGNLDALLRQLRADLLLRGLQGTAPPRLRLGLVQTGLQRVGFSAAEVVRAAQWAVAGQLSDCKALETNALQVEADRVHFALGGSRELGRAFLR